MTQRRLILSWKNWSVYHMIAALKIMASKEILRRKLRLGVVTSQHPSEKERSMSAAAMIVDSNADDTSPVVWVHNNRLGSGEESNGAIQQSVHWQVFGPQNDLSGPMEVKRWGIVRPVEECQVKPQKGTNPTHFIHHDTSHHYSISETPIIRTDGSIFKLLRTF
ncbi:hypothetical protein H4I96_11971 [Botrytis cinerea]